MAHIKIPKNSLLGSEILLKRLILYLLMNKIIRIGSGDCLAYKGSKVWLAIVTATVHRNLCWWTKMRQKKRVKERDVRISLSYKHYLMQRHCGIIWTKTKRIVRLRHIRKFYKDINANIRLCQKLYDNCSNFGLRNFLGHYDPWKLSIHGLGLGNLPGLTVKIFFCLTFLKPQNLAT